MKHTKRPVPSDHDLAASVRSHMAQVAELMAIAKTRGIEVNLNVMPKDDGTFAITDTIRKITPL